MVEIFSFYISFFFDNFYVFKVEFLVWLHLFEISHRHLYFSSLLLEIFDRFFLLNFLR